MRLSVLALLSIVLVLPLSGAEPDRASLQSGLQSSLERLRQAKQSLISRAFSVDLTLDPRLEEHFSALRADLLKQVEVLADKNSDAEPVRKALIAALIKVNALTRLEHKLTVYIFHVGRFAKLGASPQLAQYRDLLREQLVADQARAIAGSDPEEPTEPVRLRLEQFDLLLTLSESEQQVAKNHPLLDPAKPPLDGYLAWSRQVREVLAREIAQPIADLSAHDLGLGRVAIVDYQVRSSDWVALLDLENRLREAQAPGNDDPARAALRANLTKQVELVDERGRIHDTGDLRKDGPVYQAAVARLEQIDRDLQRLDAADDQIASARARQDQLDGLRKGIVEKLPKCPERIRKDLTGRLEQIIAERGKELAKQLKAAVDHDRVDAAEADGELQILELRLQHLDEEASFEGEQAEAEQAWRGREQDQGVRELAKRYQDARERLAKARAKQLKTRVAQQQIQNRITLLQLKADLTDTQVGEGDGTMQRLRDEIDQLQRDLGEAAAKAGERAKDAKDAERIPLVKPGVDDF